MTQKPALGTIGAACEYTNLSRATAYRLLATGDWTSIKVGRARRVVMASVDTWIERQRTAQLV